MTPKKRLGEMLMDAGVIGEPQLKAALGHQRQWGVRLGQALVDLKLATEPDIVRALAVKYGFEVARLEGLEPYALEQALKLLPREFALRHNVFPMGVDTGSVTVAMSDPTNLAVVDEVRFRSGRRVKVCIGGDREIADALRRHYPAEGEVEAIALDLDVDGEDGEAMHDPFGGGSKDDLAAFFASAEPASPEPGRPAAGAPAPIASPPVAARAPAAATPAVKPAAAPPAPARPAAPSPATPRPAPPGAAGSPPQGGGPAPRPVDPRAASQGRPAHPSGGPAGAPPGRLAPAASTQPIPRGPPPQGAARPIRDPAAPPASPAPAPAAPEPGPGPGTQGARAPPPQGQPRVAPFARLEDEITGSEPILATDLVPDDEPGGRPLTEAELAILESLDRLASGAHAEPEIVKPAQAMAALVRLLLRKRIILEQELLDELVRK